MTVNITPRATSSESWLERHTVTGPRILVVDDDPAFGEATARVLRAAGFEVFLAADHRLALEGNYSPLVSAGRGRAAGGGVTEG